MCFPWFLSEQWINCWVDLVFINSYVTYFTTQIYLNKNNFIFGSASLFRKYGTFSKVRAKTEPITSGIKQSHPVFVTFYLWMETCFQENFHICHQNRFRFCIFSFVCFFCVLLLFGEFLYYCRRVFNLSCGNASMFIVCNFHVYVHAKVTWNWLLLYSKWGDAIGIFRSFHIVHRKEGSTVGKFRLFTNLLIISY